MTSITKRATQGPKAKENQNKRKGSKRGLKDGVMKREGRGGELDFFLGGNFLKFEEISRQKKVESFLLWFPLFRRFVSR